MNNQAWKPVPRARRRAMKALAVLPAVVGVGAVQTARPEAAASFPQDPGSCEDRTIAFYLDTPWDAYPQAKQWVQDAIGRWNQPLDYTGQRLVEITNNEGTGNGGVRGTLFNGDDDELGSSECAPIIGAKFELNVDHISDKEVVWQVGKHEMGHLLGAEHSGARDSHNGDNPPIMTSCWDRALFNTANIVSQDDYAYLAWLWSSLPNRQMLANLGFEQGTSFWGAYHGALDWSDSNGATGPGHARYKATHIAIPTGGGYWDGSMYQTVNVATGDDTEQYRAVINYKAESGNHRHDLSFTVLAQAIDYQDDNGNDCEYADGLNDLNDPIPRNPSSYPYSGFGVWMSKYVQSIYSAPPTSWTSSATGWAASPFGQIDGMRTYIAIGHASSDEPLTGGGTEGNFERGAYVLLDNVRIEGT